MFTLDDAFARCKISAFIQSQLKDTYSQDHRRYHNLDHLSDMLRWVPEIETKLEDYEVEILVNAILFHDLVYYPRPVPPGYNEALSGIEYCIQEFWYKTPFVEGQLYPNVGSTVFECLVVEAINATAHHTKTQENLSPTSQWLLDLDLQAFARPWEEYMKTSNDLEAEWQIINPGRSFSELQPRFLEALLQRPNIYYRMKDWEKKARDNIERHLSLFSSSIRTGDVFV